MGILFSQQNNNPKKDKKIKFYFISKIEHKILFYFKFKIKFILFKYNNLIFNG